LATELDVSLRPDDLGVLDDFVWSVHVSMVVVASAIASVVLLGLFRSAAGIFALMSVSVARRTREIGLRGALGATPARLLGHIFRRALILVVGGVAAGNSALLLFVALSVKVDIADVGAALLTTSVAMLTVGLLACAEPARRALRIQPIDALKGM
jgi:ABC-type antimicrobial peptide transport system permease subunit